jgi:hypothetical protein
MNMKSSWLALGLWNPRLKHVPGATSNIRAPNPGKARGAAAVRVVPPARGLPAAGVDADRIRLRKNAFPPFKGSFDPPP